MEENTSIFLIAYLEFYFYQRLHLSMHVYKSLSTYIIFVLLILVPFSMFLTFMLSLHFSRADVIVNRKNNPCLFAFSPD